MASKFLLIISLSFVFGLSDVYSSELNLPLDCQDGEIYPWFENCNKYILCNGTKAVVMNCPDQLSWDESVRNVCPGPAQNYVSTDCGYKGCCSGDVTDVCNYTSPIGKTMNLAFYGVCVSGKIIFQSRCRSEDKNFRLIFSQNKTMCVPSCDDGKVIRDVDCKGYYECVDKAFIHRSCPDTSLFNGDRCVYDYICNESNIKPDVTIPSKPTTSNPTTSTTTSKATTSTTSKATTSTTSQTTTPVTTLHPEKTRRTTPRRF